MKLSKVASGLIATGAIVSGASLLGTTAASAQSIQQQIIQNTISNILQDIRDQIQGRRLAVPGRVMRFSGEADDQIDPTNPFAANNPNNPLNALAYTKTGPIYTKAPVAPTPSYLYGINFVASGDESNAGGVKTDSFSSTGSFDVTKVGVFSATDALTFVATGSGVWSHTVGLDTNTGSGSGTLAYLNGNFSTDFTATASWTHESLAAVGLVAPNSTSMSYTGNAQYRFDLADTWFIEPTVGLTYTDLYSANFGTLMGDSTEVHGGARVGYETTWNGVRVQPQVSAAAFSLVSQSGAAAPGGAVPGAATGAPTGEVGVRASGKLNFIWSDKFSSYVEAHGSSISNIDAYGVSGGLRWSWN